MRSVVPLPDELLDGALTLSTLLLAAGLAALGLGVRLGSVARVGVRPLLLGLGAWFTAATTALGLIVTIG